jgi:hypothetical protein
MNHSIWLRKGRDNTDNVTDYYQFGSHRFYTTGSIQDQSLRMIINSSGNVGIGTTSPNQLLDVNGTIATRTDIRWNGTGLNASDKKLYSPADGDLEWMTNDGAGVHGFAVSHQGTKKVYLNTSGNSYLNGGNVGIGTTSPGYKLDVTGDVQFSGNMYKSGSSATNSGINLPTSGAGITWGSNASRIYDDGDLRITTDDNMHFSTSAGEKITIYAGKVGINNTAPGNQFEVTGSMYQQGGSCYLGYDTSNQIFLGQNRSGVFCKLNDDIWFSDPQNGTIRIRNYNDTADGTLVGIFTNTSTRASKKDVTTFDQTKLESLYQDTIKTKVCSWRYKEEAEYVPLKYGPILDDSPPYFTVTPDGESLYINQYVAMLHGALQVAIQKIESLETRLSTLENNTTQ